MGENRESMNRIKEAAKYQKMAIHALFPESMESHLQVMGQELKGMAKDLLLDVVKSVMASQMNSENESRQNADSASGTRKVQSGNTGEQSGNRKSGKIQKVTIE